MNAPNNFRSVAQRAINRTRRKNQQFEIIRFLNSVGCWFCEETTKPGGFKKDSLAALKTPQKDHGGPHVCWDCFRSLYEMDLISKPVFLKGLAHRI